MCGRYGGPKRMGGYTEIVKAVFKTPLPPLDCEFSPGSVAPVLARNAEGQNTLIAARWSLIPSTYRGKIADWKMTIAHARLEDVTERPAFSQAWAKKRRVVVPASCYWEWSERLGRSRVPKQRWRIEPDSEEPFGMAGLWDYAQTSDGAVLSFAILTRTPGERMQRLHDREPVVLAPSDMAAWLNGETLDLSAPWNDSAFRLTPVA